MFIYKIWNAFLEANSELGGEVQMTFLFVATHHFYPSLYPSYYPILYRSNKRVFLTIGALHPRK